MKNMQRFLVIGLLSLVLLIILAGLRLPALAQGDDPPEPPPIIRVVVDSHPAMDELLPALTDALQDALDDHDLAASLEVETYQPSLNAQADVWALGDESLFIHVSYTCPDDPYCLFVVMLPYRMPQSALFSPRYDTGYSLVAAGARTMMVIRLDNRFEAELSLFTNLAVGLTYFTNSDCIDALPVLEQSRAQVDPQSANRYLIRDLDLLSVVCLREQREYQAAVDVLQALRTEDDSWRPENEGVIIDAYIADSLAQLFRFDEALAIDDANIALAKDTLVDVPEHYEILWERLLADLYLLRGQHRLYLYEWDAVLADYDAALALANAPPRAYYYRGLLYYTQDARQQAYDDLTRFLALETDPYSHLIPLTEQYLAELTDLLATPESR